MQPSKIDSVYDYLTPKKFLTSLMNPAHKNKPSRSEMGNLDSPPNLQQSLSNLTSSVRRGRGSYKQNNASNPMNISESKLSDHSENKIRKSNEYRNRNSIHDNKVDVKDVVESGVHDTDVLVTGNNNLEFNNTHDINLKFSSDGESRANIKNSHVYAKSEIGGKTIGNFDNVQPLNKKLNIPMRKNVEVSKLVVQELMGKLINIKDQLERQIIELKKLLDETADGLMSMEQQFQKVKQKILMFTSRSLDSAFRLYKKNLPNWAIFESVEHTGMERIAEMSETIQLLSDQSKFKSIGGREQIQRMIEGYAQQLDETRDAKMECYSQRPIISQEKVRKLQVILKQIGNF